jgi:hypothetical protein
MHVDWSSVLEALAGLLLAGLTAAITAATGWLASRTKSTLAGAVINNVGELAQSVVAHVEVSLRPQIQTALADGKLSTEEAARLPRGPFDAPRREVTAGLDKLVPVKQGYAQLSGGWLSDAGAFGRLEVGQKLLPGWGVFGYGQIASARREVGGGVRFTW